MNFFEEARMGRYFFIEMEVNPNSQCIPIMLKGSERQQAGAYIDPDDARRDFSSIVLFLTSSFPGSTIVRMRDLPDDIEEAVDIIKIGDNEEVTVLSHVRISCIDHRGHTKH